MPDAIDLLIELSNLRRAYADLQSNYILYQIDLENIKAGNKDLDKMRKVEIEFWKDAYEQENKWYKSFWFGLACGVTGAVAIVFVSGYAK